MLSQLRKLFLLVSCVCRSATIVLCYSGLQTGQAIREGRREEEVLLVKIILHACMITSGWSYLFYEEMHRNWWTVPFFVFFFFFAEESMFITVIVFSVLLFHIVLIYLGQKRVNSHFLTLEKVSWEMRVSSDQQRLLCRICRSKSLLARIQNELPLVKDLWIKDISVTQDLSLQHLKPCLPRIFFHLSLGLLLLRFLILKGILG